jgi:hypothetical protein
MRVADDVAEIEAVLSALVGESSESARVELASGALSHPGFRRQTKCKQCTCQDQKLRTQRLHTWTSSHIAQNKYRKSTLLHQDVQDIHKVINITYSSTLSKCEIQNIEIWPSQAADWGFATNTTRTHQSPETLRSPPCCLHLLLSIDCNGDNLGLGGF